MTKNPLIQCSHIINNQFACIRKTSNIFILTTRTIFVTSGICVHLLNVVKGKVCLTREKILKQIGIPVPREYVDDFILNYPKSS